MISWVGIVRWLRPLEIDGENKTALLGQSRKFPRSNYTRLRKWLRAINMFLLGNKDT
jgi:hypothetical protein